MSEVLPIFVYGSLLKGFENNRKYVEPYPHHVLPAKISGGIYHLPDRGYPALLDEGEWVYGEILVFPDEIFGTALFGLDELESFYSPGDQRNEYERVVVPAMRLDTGEELTVYTYLFCDNSYVKSDGIYLTDGNWRSYMQNVKHD